MIDIGEWSISGGGWLERLYCKCLLVSIYLDIKPDKSDIVWVIVWDPNKVIAIGE